jgi:hypothetical protein
MWSRKGTNCKHQSSEEGREKEGPNKDQGCSQKEKEVIRP